MQISYRKISPKTFHQLIIYFTYIRMYVYRRTYVYTYLHMCLAKGMKQAMKNEFSNYLVIYYPTTIQTKFSAQSAELKNETPAKHCLPASLSTQPRLLPALSWFAIWSANFGRLLSSLIKVMKLERTITTISSKFIKNMLIFDFLLISYARYFPFALSDISYLVIFVCVYIHTNL